MSERDMIQGLTFTGFFKRLFQKKVSMVVPEKIMWDGTDSDGNIAGDGKYSYSFYTWDERDNIAAKKRGLVVVDNNAPRVTLLNDENLFSPNGDNKKDTLLIRQNVNSEADDEWQAGFRDSGGKVVKSYLWKGDVPGALSWDGKNDQGDDVPEGLYYYFIETTDHAGNRASASLQEIALTRQYETADIRLSQDRFSFKRDSELKMFMRLSGTAGLQGWKIEVRDAGDHAVKTLEGEKTIPPFVTWDCKNDRGEPLSDGEYRVTLSTVFKSGNTPLSFEKKLVVDSTPPEASIKHSPDYFSPDGDGEKDVLTIRPGASDNTGISSWTIRIYAPSGEVFKQFTGTGAVPEQILWDGPFQMSSLSA